MGRLNSRRLRTSDASSERPGDIRKASSPSARTTVLPRIFKPLSAQGMVEYALGLALSLYLIMGVVDFGRGFFVYNILANVAREGARYATVLKDSDGTDRTSDEIVTYATGRAGIGGVTASVVDRGTVGNPTIVQASSTFSPLTPPIGNVCCPGGSMSLTARSSMIVEK